MNKMLLWTGTAALAALVLTGAAALALVSVSRATVVSGGTAVSGYADDRAEIENLENRYWIAIDAGDTKTLMSAWAEDGVLVWAGGTEVGKAAIEKVYSRAGDTMRGPVLEGATSRWRTRHFITNQVIDVNGNTAKEIAYWFNLTNHTPQHDVQLLYFGHMEEELVKVNGKWFIKKRHMFNESGMNRAVFYPGLGEKDPGPGMKDPGLNPPMPVASVTH